MGGLIIYVFCETPSASGGISSSQFDAIGLISNKRNNAQIGKDILKNPLAFIELAGYAQSLNDPTISKLLNGNLSNETIGRIYNAVAENITNRFNDTTNNNEVIEVYNDIVDNTRLHPLKVLAAELAEKRTRKFSNLGEADLSYIKSAEPEVTEGVSESTSSTNTNTEVDGDMGVDSDIDSTAQNGYNIDAEKRNIVPSVSETVRLDTGEEAALLAYKSGGSYLLNANLRESEGLSHDHQIIINSLDKALSKLPRYKGKVYRNIQFDGFGDQAARDQFVAEHIVGDIVRYPAYTSSSTKPDGYPLDGEFVVHFEIESTNGRNLEGYGNNFESEVLFPRNTVFVVNKIFYDQKGTPTIYLTEVTNGQEAISRRGTQETLSVDYRGQQKESSDSRTTKVQRLSAQNTEDSELPITVSERNTERNISQGTELQGIQTEGDRSLKSNSGVSETESSGSVFSSSETKQNSNPDNDDGVANSTSEGGSNAEQETTVDSDKYAKDKSFWQAENQNKDAKISKTLKEKIASLFSKKTTDKPVSIGEIVKLIEKEFGVPTSQSQKPVAAFGLLRRKIQLPQTPLPKEKPPAMGGFSFGGEGGIRTLEPLLMFTRFPIVRARPTTRLLHRLPDYYIVYLTKNHVLFFGFAIFFSFDPLFY